MTALFPVALSILYLIPAKAGLYFGEFIHFYAGTTQISAKICMLCHLHALGLDIINHQSVNNDLVYHYITMSFFTRKNMEALTLNFAIELAGTYHRST
jgi:hypothetical protein